MSHAVGAWVLNISLTLLVLLAVGFALRAIIKQRKRKKSIGCMGCPYSGSCGQRAGSCVQEDNSKIRNGAQ